MTATSKAKIAGKPRGGSASKLPPGPKSSAPGGQLVAMTRDPLRFLMKVARDYGEVAHFKLGPQDTVLVNNPEYISDILVAHDWNFLKGRGLKRARRVLGRGLLTSEGNFHRRQRRLAQPAFHKQRIAGYAETMVQYTSRLRDRWRDGETVDMAQEMMRLTLAIVAKTLFDADVEAEAAEIGQALTEVLKMFETFSSPLTDILDKLPTPANRRIQRARERLDQTIYRIIEERRASGEDRGDLLSMLLLAQDEEGSGGMSDEQLRDEIMTLFLAGHETTANALTWTWYLLAQNPKAEQALVAELDRVLGRSAPTLGDLSKLPYTEMVVKESMRLYPPAWGIGRRALADFEIGGYRVPAGTNIFIMQWLTHRDARFFPDPERFDPERWRDDPVRKGKIPRFAYFPFAGGPRVCIGAGFAMMEATLLLATIAQRYRFTLAADAKVSPLFSVTLRPKRGLPMRLIKR